MNVGRFDCFFLYSMANIVIYRIFIIKTIYLLSVIFLFYPTQQIEARGQTYSRQILVADYVMPKFQMDIQLPKEVLFTEGRFTVNITAK